MDLTLNEKEVDIQEDVCDAFDENINPAISGIPSNEYGIYKGTFTVTITWNNEQSDPMSISND